MILKQLYILTKYIENIGWDDGKEEWRANVIIVDRQ